MTTRRYVYLGMLALSVLLPGASSASNTGAAKTVAADSIVKLDGTVDSITDERHFILRDDAGIISVELGARQSLVLQPGDKVTVTGVITQQAEGASVQAVTVDSGKSPPERKGQGAETLRAAASMEGAAAYDIARLPDQGIVKVRGRVDSVIDDKQFTLRDATGLIAVDVKSQDSAAVAPGAEVKVVGYINNGGQQKSLDAHKVAVVRE